MCYNSTISFTFFAIGILVSGIIYFGSFTALRRSGIYWLLIFYSLMELLQGVQYYFINECSLWINQFLTEVAYGFVLAQPFIWNWFFYENSLTQEKPMFQVAMWLCLCWVIVNILARVMYKKPGFVAQTKDESVFAGKRVCTKKKLTHLYWEWTSANFGDLNANFLTYLMLWFIPALVSVKHRISSIVLICSALIGAWMSYVAKEPFIFTSVWCYISVPIVLSVILQIL